MLFETGGRISEVVGLTLGDWVGHGMRREVTAFSKGSKGRRVKFLRFSDSTAKLLRRYVDSDRRRHDPQRHSLDYFLRASKSGGIDLHSVPLFLTARKTRLTPSTFRDLYWVPACAAAGLDADVHQARHWYVTSAIRQIYETSSKPGEIERRLRELIEYMKWKNGKATLACYEHYFDAARHREVQDVVHARLEESLRNGMAEGEREFASKAPASPPSPASSSVTSSLRNADAGEEVDLNYLRLIGDIGVE
jgi:integrase